MRKSLTGLALLLAAAPAAAFDLQGHRGARGVYPENTLPAFAHALTVGVTTLELDIGISADDRIVVAHDRRLNADFTRGPDGRYLERPTPTLRSLTLARIKTFDVGVAHPGGGTVQGFPRQKAVPGTRMPTLEEVAALVRKSGNGAVRFNIETKISPLAADETADPETFARLLVAELRRLGIAPRATIQSFDWRTLALAAKIAPEIPRVCLTIQQGNTPNVPPQGKSPWLAGHDPADHGGSVPRLVKAAGCAAWSPFWRDVTDAAIKEAKAIGLPVVVWTVNRQDEIEAFIARGVDGIITDFPEAGRAAMAARGLALPGPTPVSP